MQEGAWGATPTHVAQSCTCRTTAQPDVAGARPGGLHVPVHGCCGPGPPSQHRPAAAHWEQERKSAEPGVTSRRSHGEPIPHVTCAIRWGQLTGDPASNGCCLQRRRFQNRCRSAGGAAVQPEAARACPCPSPEHAHDPAGTPPWVRNKPGQGAPEGTGASTPAAVHRGVHPAAALRAPRLVLTPPDLRPRCVPQTPPQGPPPQRPAAPPDVGLGLRVTLEAGLGPASEHGLRRCGPERVLRVRGCPGGWGASSEREGRPAVGESG